MTGYVENEKLLWFRKFKKAIYSSKGFSFGFVLLKSVFTRIFFRKIVPIAPALTIFVPCFFESMLIYATEVGPKCENSFLMATNGIKENITTPSSSVNASPVNKKLFVEKLNFLPEGISEFFSSLVKAIPFFSAFVEKVPYDYTKECSEGA